MAGSISPLVVLTRPAGRNAALANDLRVHGLSTLELPVLQVDTAPFNRGNFPLPADFDLVIFVSTAALSAYQDQLLQLPSRPDTGTHRGCVSGPRFVAAVGAATATALAVSPMLAHAQVLAPQPGASSDSEGLWPHIEARLSEIGSALIVRGQNGREWLGEQLENAGVRVVRHCSYQRATAHWAPSQVQLLSGALTRHGGEELVWLLTSSHGVDALFELLFRHGLLAGLRGARFVAVHERVAQRLKSQYAGYFPDEVGPAVTLCTPDNAAMCHALAAMATP